MQKPFRFLLLITVIFVLSCVTINIYFPAAAAEKVADEIIEDIQGEKIEDQNTNEPEVRKPGSAVFFNKVALAIINAGIPAAQAAQANLSIDTAQIRKMRASMKARFKKLVIYYNNGHIGIVANGLISLRDPSQVPLRERTQLNKLVKKENADRTALYRAIAEANGHPEWTAEIQASFAKRWISNAHTGWWYQAANGSWTQK